MKNKINHTTILNSFFLKVLAIQKSIEAINNSWLASINLSIANHHFTDPINYLVQDDKKQVEHFNKLFNTDYKEIKWANKILSNAQIVISEDNKANISREFLSNIFCQLSVILFEHICVLLKDLSNSKGRNNFDVINDFDLEFRAEVLEFDKQKIIKTPTILILHNLRLFRNCITHNGGKISNLGSEFEEYNQKLKDGKYRDLEVYGSLKKKFFAIHYLEILGTSS
ncbi:hypothetical protein EZ449_20925 [Pedobacter frigidisoli]|uniref:Uncharacterized protein n=1 Tax=Pedobacter frigidisoli TaxID=2530455 RepID=A0A4R0NHZ0_9SPHI|nr:hypothetical protein [Pedobacter frigidisoli]TCD00260.1 hypothetical protein EZ449_20925 [Pedobacter frigidisoli]